ncbi:MAG: phage holin family protein [Chloroflexi bacterium]|jgi:putative membrane protein|nr:phage holin family protein [Chloroflexota bacterium]
MKGLIATVVAAGIALWVAVRLVPGIVIPSADFAAIPEDLVAFGTVALVFGIANGLVKPIVKLLALPINLLTTGLFGIVLNVVLFLGAAWVSDQVGGRITVGDFPPDLFTADTLVAAAIGSVVVGLVTAVVGLILPD